MMIDADETERAAMKEGGCCGGEYLDAIGKTDLAKLTENEWDTFVMAIVSGFVEAMQAAPVCTAAPSDLGTAAELLFAPGKIKVARGSLDHADIPY